MAGVGFLFALIISTLILIAMLTSVPTEEMKKLELTYIISGCSASRKNVDYTPAQQDSLNISGESNSIVIERGLNHLCCLNISLTYKREGSLIKIFEIQEGLTCRCVCYSSISANISHLKLGKYTVEYYSVINRTDIPYQENLINITEIYVK